MQGEEEAESEFIMEFGQPLTDGSTAVQSGLHWRTLLSRYKFALRQANSTDQFLRDVLGDNRQNFERLSLPEAEFDNLIENLMEKMNSQGHTCNPALSQLYTDVGRLRRERHNFELDFQKNFNERMTEFLKSDANIRNFVNEELEKLSIFVRKCTDCQKALLAKLGPMSACVREINDVEETQLSDLLFAAETYKQLQYDLKQGNMFYEMVLRILRHFSLTLTQVEENRAENIDNAAFAAFVNLLDELLDDSPDDPPAGTDALSFHLNRKSNQS
ncbi:unnamed protein product [Dibothriocephalus latus]|uniref:ALIX V-shaped domain-containing protein n=1 Tax=Dibothriocephalus latus TaxID=60516 RepID=A0A3P6V115_DIBLA|nr:unnamed protein product [Dibothriocephalus latus]